MEDYILSYQTTGRPPPPVPQEPTDENQRKVLGIPPLFKPQTEITPADGLPNTSGSTLGLNVASSSLLSSSSQSTTKQKIVNPTDVPLGQEFKVTVIAAEKYHNIVCMPEYEGFSPEVCSLDINITTCCVDLAPVVGTSLLCLSAGKCHIPSPNHHGPFCANCQRTLNGRFIIICRR